MASQDKSDPSAAGGPVSATLTAGAPPTLTAVNGGEITIALSGLDVYGPLTVLVADTSATALTVTAASLAAGSAGAGTLTLDTADNRLEFTPAAGFAGQATAQVTVANGLGASVTQLVNIDVVVEASPPVVVQPNHTVTTTGPGTTIIKTYTPGGALVGVESSGDHVGGYTEVDFADGSGTTYASEIRSGGGGFSNVLRFDGQGNRTGASFTQVTSGQTLIYNQDANQQLTTESIVRVSGAVTQTQSFAGAWVQTSANITTDLGGGASMSQTFDGAWTMTGATYATHPSAGVTVVQTFDGSWTQTGATVTTVAGAVTETQTFDGAWNQTGATIVTVAGAATETQYFDAAWAQTGATMVTVSGDQTFTQTFDASWTQTGATITTAVNAGGIATRVDAYDGGWVLEAEADTATDGGVSYYAYGQSGGGTSFIAAAGHSTTFVIQPGQLAGDDFAGLHTVGGGGALHDVIDFVGYGAGAALTQVDATHWQVSAAGDPTETFTLTGGATLAAGDYAFVAAVGAAPAAGPAGLSIASVDNTGYLTAADVASGVRISGAATDTDPSDVVGETVTVMLNNQAYVTAVTRGGGWTLAIPAAGLAGLTDHASYQITAKATDNLGHPATAASTVTVDRSVTLAINLIDGDGFIDSAETATGIQVTGTSTGAFAGQAVTVTLNNAQYTGAVAADGTWSVEINANAVSHLTNGTTYAVTAAGRDVTGQAASATASVTVNLTSGGSFISGQAAAPSVALLTQYMAAGLSGEAPAPAAALAVADPGAGRAAMTLLATPMA